jgi:glycerol-3-phosphate O-acyltransferase
MSDFTAFERLTLPLVRWLVALWVRPSVLPDDVKSRLGQDRAPVYALEKRSVIDLAVLEYVCRERRLPDPHAPVGAARALSDSLLFLERRTGFFGSRIDRRMPEALRALSTAAGDDIAFDPELVPVSLFWGRSPGREDSWFRLLVAEDWDIGGRFRKLLSLLLNGRNLLLLFGSRWRCSLHCPRHAEWRAARGDFGASCGCSSATSARRRSGRTCRTAGRS